MFQFRKISLFVALLGLSAFASLSVAEAFHHHGALESHDDCSICSWQQVDSKATAAPHPPSLVPTLLSGVLSLVFYCVTFPRFIVASGRSPPVLL